MPDIVRLSSTVELVRSEPCSDHPWPGAPIDHAETFREEILEGDDGPGLDWSLSAETIELMQAIDDNMRLALTRGRSAFLD